MQSVCHRLHTVGGNQVYAEVDADTFLFLALSMLTD